MEETQAAEAESPSISNIVGLTMAAIIVILGALFVREHILLGETVKLLAKVSAKCAQL